MHTQKRLLEEVCLIRLILIILLVLYHSFAPFSGSWRPLDGQQAIEPIYRWVAIISYSFMLETFTFISGYVFGYQISRKGTSSLTYRGIGLNKFRRLIIPSLVFSLIYILILKPEMLSTPLKSTMELISGVGHMWYLPMLFWCFIAIVFIEKSNLRPKTTIILLVGLALLSFMPSPLRIGSAMYYMLFFFAGYAIQLFSFNTLKIATPKWIITALSIYVIALLLSKSSIALYISELNGGGYLSKALSLIIERFGQLLYALPGVAMVYLISYYIIYKKKIRLNIRLINLSTYCFGIYLFQQFILQWIYYHTEAANIISIIYLPWIAFLFTLILSLLLTKLTLSTRAGRLLIG